MILVNYLDQISDGIEFLVALGSIIGLLGIIVGLLGALAGSSRRRTKFYGVLFISFLLVAICGLHTGTKYFRIF